MEGIWKILLNIESERENCACEVYSYPLIERRFTSLVKRNIRSKD